MDEVSAAFDATPRRDFLPPGVRQRASYDGPLPLVAGQTCSQPRTVDDMLRLLDVRPGQRVLDVGSGSGWTTALLAHLVGPSGSVLGAEIEPELVSLGSANLAATDRPWASIRLAVSGVLGDPGGEAYDRVLVSAMAASLPEPLVEQLADDGVMVVPVDGAMLRVTNPGAVVTRHGHYRFVPLR